MHNVGLVGSALPWMQRISHALPIQPAEQFEQYGGLARIQFPRPEQSGSPGQSPPSQPRPFVRNHHNKSSGNSYIEFLIIFQNKQKCR